MSAGWGQGGRSVLCHGPTLGDLTERIRTTMPPDSPGKLTPQGRVDVTAHVLKVGGVPARADELREIACSSNRFELSRTKP